MGGNDNRGPPADPLLVPCLLEVAGKDRKDGMDDETRFVLMASVEEFGPAEDQVTVTGLLHKVFGTFF